MSKSTIHEQAAGNRLDFEKIEMPDKTRRRLLALTGSAELGAKMLPLHESAHIQEFFDALEAQAMSDLALLPIDSTNERTNRAVLWQTVRNLRNTIHEFARGGEHAEEQIAVLLGEISDD